MSVPGEEFEQPWTLAGEVRRLQYDVRQLREFKVAVETNDLHLARDVASLTMAVKELQTAIDRSRGALWAIGAASAVIGAAAGAGGAILTFFSHTPK